MLASAGHPAPFLAPGLEKVDCIKNRGAVTGHSATFLALGLKKVACIKNKGAVTGDSATFLAPRKLTVSKTEVL
jgi:hypothetical protein